MNTGIGDAVNLAWKLAAVINGQAGKDLLDSYEPERIPFAQKLVSTTDRAFTFVTTTGSLATQIRLHLVPLVLPLFFRFRSMRRLMFLTVSQTAIKYPQSFLSQGKAGRIKGGDRLSWIKIDNKDLSFAGNFEWLSSKQWQVHCYGNISSELINIFTSKKIPFYIFPWTREAKKAGYLEKAIYVIRPDGYVGLADPNGDIVKISAYISKYTF
jgi:hypothetical protein